MEEIDWLGDLNWHGYPNLGPVRDAASAPAKTAARPPAKAAFAKTTDPRLSELSRENDALRERLSQLSRLAPEFERRLAEAAAAWEDAALGSERLAGELEAAKAANARLYARDAARESDLRLERERRADAEKALFEARRKISELTAEADRPRSSAADPELQLLRREMRDLLEKFRRLQEPSGPIP